MGLKDLRRTWSMPGGAAPASDPHRDTSKVNLEALLADYEDAEAAVRLVAVALADGKASLEDLKDQVAAWRRARTAWDLARGKPTGSDEAQPDFPVDVSPG